MKQHEIIELLQQLITDTQSDLHTATIAKITTVNETTINCQPVINRMMDGRSIKLPEFIEVPLEINQGGGSYTSYPVAVGDYCILYVMERCFDSWWNGQDFVSPIDARMHDYSDCFAKVGVNPKSSSIPIPTKITQKGDTLQIGDYEHEGDLHQVGNVLLEGDIDITGDYTQTGAMNVTGNVTITGNLTVNGNISFTGQMQINGVPGYTGAFATGDSRTVTVNSGLIMTVT